MSQSETQCDLWLSRFREHLQEECYSCGVVRNYPIAVRRFLRDLEQRGQTVESVSPADVESYLSTLGAQRRRGPVLGWHSPLAPRRDQDAAAVGPRRVVTSGGAGNGALDRRARDGH